jgi:hypothetical protein
VSPEEARLKALSKIKDIKSALARERSADDAEQRMLDEFFETEQRLRSSEERSESLNRLRARLDQWTRTATHPAPSAERDQARRLLNAARAGASSRTNDPDYLKLLEQSRTGGAR